MSLLTFIPKATANFNPRQITSGLIIGKTPK
jgi:hypothetical protein